MPFDKLTVLSKVEGLTAPSKAEWLRCAAPSSLQRTVSTPHSSGFARLEFGAFYIAIE